MEKILEVRDDAVILFGHGPEVIQQRPFTSDSTAITDDVVGAIIERCALYDMVVMHISDILIHHLLADGFLEPHMFQDITYPTPTTIRLDLLIELEAIGTEIAATLIIKEDRKEPFKPTLFLGNLAPDIDPLEQLEAFVADSVDSVATLLQMPTKPNEKIQ